MKTFLSRVFFVGLFLGIFNQPTIANTTTYLPFFSCNQEFFDIGGSSNNYENGVVNETTTFCPQVQGEVISINFTLFDLENNGDNCYDQLMIFNGNDVTHSVIASPNGTTKGWCWDKQSGSEGGSGNLEGLTLTSTDDSGCLTFVFNSDGGVSRSGWAAAITCSLPPTCPAPNNLNAENITHNSALLKWENGNGSNQTNSKVEWGVEGFANGNGNQVTISTNSVSATNLWASTKYEFYVQEDCSSDGASAWVGPFSFKTNCTPFEGDSFADAYMVNSLPFSATINTNDCYSNIMGESSPDAFYTFTTSSCADYIEFSTCTSETEFDTYIRLLDSEGTEIATNDDSETGCDFLINGKMRSSKIHYDVNPNTVYTVVVEGFGNESGNVGVEISEILLVDTMHAFALINDVSCNGMIDGSILTSIEGGVEPITATWSSGATGLNPTGLSEGIHELTLQDACGQILKETFEILTPEILQVSTMAIDEIYSGQNNGSITCTPTGGTAPYSYLWNNDATTSSIENLSVGQYCVTITDAVGCSAETCDLVLAGTTSIDDIEELSKFSIYPNPVSESAVLEIELSNPKDITIQIYSSVGQLFYEIKNKNIVAEKFQINVSDYSAGIYFLQLTIDGQQTTKKLIVRN